LCEKLIYFTTKQGNLKNETPDQAEDINTNKQDERRKKMEDDIKAGKIEVSMTNAEKLAMQQS